MTEPNETYKSRAPIAEILWEDAWVETKDFLMEASVIFVDSFTVSVVSTSETSLLFSLLLASPQP